MAFSSALYFSDSTEKKLQHAAVLFNTGDYAASYTQLEKIKDEISPSQLNMYRGCIHLAQSNCEKAIDAFNAAASFVKRDVDSNNLLTEIKCLHILASIQQSQLINFSLKDLPRTSTSSSFCLNYFNGLEKFYLNNFEQALSVWSSTPNENTDSYWLTHAFNLILPAHKRAFYKKQCEIAVCTQIHQLLEIENKLIHNELASFELEFLYTFISLKIMELGEVPLAYDLKASHLFKEYLQMKSADAFFHEKVCSLYTAMVYALLENQTIDKLACFIDKLALLADKSALEDISVACCQRLISHSKEFSTALLLQIPPESPIKNSVAKQMKKELLFCINEDNVSQAHSVWKKLNKWESDSLEKIAHQLAIACQTKILEKLRQTDENFLDVIAYISFLKELYQKINPQVPLSQQIVYLSGSYWSSKPKMASQLTFIAESLATDREPFLEAVEHELKVAWVNAHHSQLFETLCELDKTCKHFHLQPLTINVKGEVANLLADAKVFFNKGLYKEVEEIAKWIACIDTENILNLTLLGFSQYNQKKYQEAAATLMKISASNTQITELLGICLIKAGKELQGYYLLTHLSHQFKLSDESLFIINALQKSPQISSYLKRQKKEIKFGLLPSFGPLS